MTMQISTNPSVIKNIFDARNDKTFLSSHLTFLLNLMGGARSNANNALH